MIDALFTYRDNRPVCQGGCTWDEVVWSDEPDSRSYMATRYCTGGCGRFTNWVVAPTNRAYGNTGHSDEERDRAARYPSFAEARAAKERDMQAELRRIVGMALDSAPFDTKDRESFDGWLDKEED